MDEVENFFCQFSTRALMVSGMGCYAEKCEKKPKSLYPTVHKSLDNVPQTCIELQYFNFF